MKNRQPEPPNQNPRRPRMRYMAAEPKQPSWSCTTYEPTAAVFRAQIKYVLVSLELLADRLEKEDIESAKTLVALITNLLSLSVSEEKEEGKEK